MKEGSMETVLDCVIPYIHDSHDLNSISLVSRRFYQLDCITRKHLTVHLHYALNPSTLSKRFPFIHSLTLKGPPDLFTLSKRFPQISVTPWITEICAKFECLKALHIRRMLVCDEDLALLAKTRGKDLRSLKIYNCHGFSEYGLLHISEYCNDLTTLSLENNYVDGEVTGEWLRELALRNTPIESLHVRFNSFNYDVEILTLVAQKCSNSLVSLKVSPTYLNYLGDAFSHAVKLQDFDGAVFDKDGDYTSFKFPPSIRGLGIRDLPVTSFSLLLPYANQLRELNLTGTKSFCQCFLIESCPNLEVLITDDVCGDMGLRVIGRVCKKLRKLTYFGHVTHMGLIALVQGCINLEYLDVTLSNISNEAIECVGTHLKNLRDFRMILFKASISMTDLHLDNGIRAMLKGCIKLKRLSLSLGYEEGLTDVGLGYIGKYGHNLTSLYLNCKGVSDAGLLKLSKGCKKLRKLHLWKRRFNEQAIATFVFNIHSLRYIWVEDASSTKLALTRPTFTAEVKAARDEYLEKPRNRQKEQVQSTSDERHSQDEEDGIEDTLGNFATCST